MNTDLEITTMRDSAELVVAVLKSLANTDRLLILCPLAQQELNVLRKSDVVTTRRDGKQIYYSIKDANLVQVLNTLYQLYCNQSYK